MDRKQRIGAVAPNRCLEQPILGSLCIHSHDTVAADRRASHLSSSHKHQNIDATHNVIYIGFDFSVPHSTITLPTQERSGSRRYRRFPPAHHVEKENYVPYILPPAIQIYRAIPLHYSSRHGHCARPPSIHANPRSGRERPSVA